MALPMNFVRANIKLLKIRQLCKPLTCKLCDYKDVEDLVHKPEQHKRVAQKSHPEEVPRHYNPDRKGVVWDKKPFKVKLEAGKRYAWCTCGFSSNQPFCDGTHRTLPWQTNNVMHFQPFRFKVEETKEVWLCNCKQTNKRPYCDGTHKKPEIANLPRGPNFG